MDGLTVDMTVEQEGCEKIIRLLVKKDGKLVKQSGFVIDHCTSKDEFLAYMSTALTAIDKVK